VHLTDDFVECFQLREICLFGSDTYRSETILQAVQILIFIDDEQSVEAGCLEEDDLALWKVFVEFLQDFANIDDVFLLLVASYLRTDGLDLAAWVFIAVELALAGLHPTDVFSVWFVSHATAAFVDAQGEGPAETEDEPYSFHVEGLLKLLLIVDDWTLGLFLFLEVGLL
jgi:hypothetical protein